MPVHPRIAPAAEQFRVSNALFRRALEGLSAEEALRRPSEKSSPMIWIAGHLASTRTRAANLIGSERSPRWAEMFGRGSEIGDASQYPSLEELLEEWDAATKDLEQALESVGERKLAEPAPRDFPVEDKSVAGAVNFLAYHEAYHVGQMAYLRKILGKESLVG